MPRELTTSERTLPHNLEAERSVLGAVLLDNHAFNHAAEVLVARDFYSERHRAIYGAMASLSEKDAPIDPVTLREELDRRDDLERAGGAATLASLVEGLPRATNVGHYARIVKDKAALRNLISSANEIIEQALDGEEDADDIIDQAERRIFEIGEDKVARGFVSTHSLALETMQEIEELAEGREHVTGVPTGFKRFDTMTAGLQPGDLVIIAGRPSMGKTALALNVAQHVALRRGGSVGIFSLEMADRQLIRRMITSEARVDAHKLASGYLSETDINKLVNCLEDLSNAQIFIDDSAAITPMEMRAKARRLAAEHGLDLLVVDYLQLVRGGGRFENRNLEIGAISRALKAMAKELKVPVLALSQLSRAPEARSEHRPQLSDLRECVTGDTLVQLADGRRVPISRLVGTTPEVLAMSPDGKIVGARSEEIWSVGTRPVFAVTLASGRTIRTTVKHRLYGAEGWVRVGDLHPGDAVRALASRQGRILRKVVGSGIAADGVSSRFRSSPSPMKIGEFAGLQKDDELREMASSDLFWDRVVAIEPAGKKEVFDLTVPGPASWIGNSVISHNSGNLEQDADVVAFIFREEIYQPADPELQGLAEIILAKQRNGPIGRIKLAFLKEYTRFENLEEDWE